MSRSPRKKWRVKSYPSFGYTPAPSMRATYDLVHTLERQYEQGLSNIHQVDVEMDDGQGWALYERCEFPKRAAATPDPDLVLGLHEKYRVERIEPDPDGKHAACRYFVLDPEHDGAALVALDAYAKEVRDIGYTKLADDLDAWLTRIFEDDPSTTG